MPSQTARKLRRDSTDPERRLWSALRDRRLRNYKFRCQRSIGPFIVDFACIEHRLVIEADGGQHADNAADEVRRAWLEAQGWQVVRFWNNDVLGNPEGVLETILRVLREMHPHPPIPRGLGPPSPARGRGFRRLNG